MNGPPEKVMKAIIFTLALLSLGLGWRSPVHAGEQPKEQTAQNQRDRLRTKDNEVTEKLTQTLASAYEASRQRLQQAGEALRKAKDDAVEGLQPELKRAQEQLDALAQRLEQGARSAKETSISAARNIEEGINLRVRRMEARTKLLGAKAKTKLAVSAAAKQDFARAEQLLGDATELLRTARAALVDDHAYDDQLDDMKAALVEASAAIKAHAQNAGGKIEQVVTDVDRILKRLEGDEKKAEIRAL